MLTLERDSRDPKIHPLEKPSEPTPSPTALPSPTPTPAITPSATQTPEPTPTLAPVPTDVEAKTHPQDASEEVLLKPSEDTLTWFWMDRTEVTNRQYQRCVLAGICSENASGYGKPFYDDNYPVVGVSWQQAQNYCQSVGRRLPNIEEWSYAVSPDGRLYPWGNEPEEPSCEHAVIRYCTKPSQPMPVGNKPLGASPDKILDLIGNVWEWTLTPGAGKDDTYVTVGGSWSNPDDTPQGGFDAFKPPNAPARGVNRQASNLGFRCVGDYILDQ